MKRLIKKANVPTIDDFYDSLDYDYEEVGLQTVKVSDIVGMSYPRNEEYNDDFSPKVKDERWEYQYELVQNGEKMEPISLIEMPNGKYVIDGDGNHRLSVAKSAQIDYIDGYVFKMVPKKENDISWEEYAKEEIEKYDNMVITYREMLEEYNRLMDIYFDNKTEENYKKYKEYEKETNDYAKKLNEFKEELDKKESEF